MFSGRPGRPIGERAAFASTLTPAGDALATQHRCVDEARRNVVDRDAHRRELHGQRLRERDDTALRGRIGRHARRARLSTRGGDVDDATPLGRKHVGQHGLRTHEHALEIDGHDAIPVLLGHLHERLEIGNAGIVDEDLHGADLCMHALDGRIDLRPASTHRHGWRSPLRPRWSDPCSALCALFIDVPNRDLRAFACEALSRCEPDTRRRTCDNYSSSQPATLACPQQFVGCAEGRRRHDARRYTCAIAQSRSIFAPKIRPPQVNSGVDPRSSMHAPAKRDDLIVSKLIPDPASAVDARPGAACLYALSYRLCLITAMHKGGTSPARICCATRAEPSRAVRAAIRKLAVVLSGERPTYADACRGLHTSQDGAFHAGRAAIPRVRSASPSSGALWRYAHALSPILAR